MLMVVYNPSKKESVHVLKGIVRAEEEFSVSVPSSFVGDVVHSYIAIINKEGTITSDSVYLGSGRVA
jgi:adenosylcobinamide amidohydrolase